MASLRKVKDWYVIQFTDIDKKRRTNTGKDHVEAILSAAFAGSEPPNRTSERLGKLPEALNEKSIDRWTR